MGKLSTLPEGKADQLVMNKVDQHSVIRSFVRRQSRLTPGQARALETLWDRFGINEGQETLDLSVVFGRKAPRVLEIGFGDGSSLIAMAQSHPDRDYLGIEVHRPGVGRLLMQAEALGLRNLKVVCADAVEVLSRSIADGAFERVHVFFPDPWPKKRHHKRRLIQPAFAALLIRKLMHGGYLHLATDWEDYARQMLEVLEATPELMNTAPEGGFATRPGERPLTKFERRGQRLGHEAYDILFQRR